MTTFAQIQEVGDLAFELAIAFGGTQYDAATAYQELVADLQAREPGETGPCIICGKGECPVNTPCHYCQGDATDWADEHQTQSRSRYGG